MVLSWSIVTFHFPAYFAPRHTHTTIKNKEVHAMSTMNPYNVALPKAVLQGHKDIVEALLRHKASVNETKTPFGSSLLYVSCQNGNKEMVDVLLRHNADVNTTVNDCSPLLISCSTGRKDIAELLLEAKANVNQAMGKERTSPLTKACKNKDVDLIKLLLRHKADVNQTGADGIHPLGVYAKHPQWYAGWRELESVAKLFFEHKAKVSLQDFFLDGAPYIIGKLIEHKANVNVNEEWNTELLGYCCMGYGAETSPIVNLKDSVKILLEKKANPNQDDNPPLYMLCEEWHVHCEFKTINGQR